MGPRYLGCVFGATEDMGPWVIICWWWLRIIERIVEPFPICQNKTFLGKSADKKSHPYFQVYHTEKRMKCLSDNIYCTGNKQYRKRIGLVFSIQIETISFYEQEVLLLSIKKIIKGTYRCRSLRSEVASIPLRGWDRRLGFSEFLKVLLEISKGSFG